MRLILKEFGLKTPEGVWVGFSKCGPSRNMSKFYKTDTGKAIGYDYHHGIFGGIRFVI